MLPLSKEEQANTFTHLVALTATLLIGWPLLRLAWVSQAAAFRYQLFATGLFYAGMVLMYGASTAYHAATDETLKRRLRVVDHIAIYVMIAGSYSTVCLCGLGGWIGWSLFGFLWACVIAGIVGKVIAIGRYPNLSLALYLAMGWAALLIIVPMWQTLSHAAFFWIVGEGVAYSAGACFFRYDEQYPYFHAVWHLFIMLGSVCHTIATVLILLPR